MPSSLLPIIVVGIAAALLLVTVSLLKLKAANSKASPTVSYPYASRGTLFSAAERSFLGVLVQCLDAQYQIHGKVRLADIIKTKTSNASERQSAFNRISRKHVDFVITHSANSKIIGVIELDDKSHNKPERQDRDVFS